MTIEELQNIVEQQFSSINWNIEPIGLYAPIDYTLALGGKRVRPLLTLLATEMLKGNIHNALSAATGLEIFHNFTLLHDDIMDKAPVRRKEPTVHVKWNENTAILSGDAMLIKAYQYMSMVNKEYLPQVLNVFSQTALEVCEGQQYDMEFETRSNVSADEYLEMIRLKTAVLLGACLQIGAIIAGASKEDGQRIYDFGINIGLAFQLKDDLLDVYGDEAVFGKKIGGDILCNKKTYLLIMALQHAKADEKAKLNEWLSKTSYNETEKIQSVTDIYTTSGAKKLCEAKIDAYYELAKKNLQDISVAPEQKIALEQLAQKLMIRNV